MWFPSYFTLFLLHYCVVGEEKHPSVIIVGAGASGIAAATKLLENSFTNITILEAEDRIGGRIHSVKFGEGLVDLGAEHCYGRKENAVYELAKDYDVLEEFDFSFENNIYCSDGSKLNSSISQDLNRIIFELFEKKYEGNETSKSTGDVFKERFNSSILPKYEGDKKNVQILKEALKFSDGQISLFNGASSWSDVSAKTDIITNNDAFVWKGVGFKTIINILMKSYPDSKNKLDIDDKIHLKKKVQKISWDQNQSVSVLTADNTTYTADYVIFTPSTGVLKKHQDTLFEPKLPSEKKNAIENTGYGSITKLFVTYSTKWWKDDDKLFSFFWTGEDTNLVNFGEGLTKKKMSWITQIRELIKVHHNPNVWSVWISGHKLSEIENLPDETLKNGVNYAVKKFLGETRNVTDVTKILKSTWTIDENFLGGTSYVKTGAYKSDESIQDKLAEPVTNAAGKARLLFAGEATHSTLYASVQGAIESGHREAKRIIEFYVKSKQ
jgi:spermine oxidase